MFVPTWQNNVVRFAIEAIDRDGNHLKLRVPIVWIPINVDGYPSDLSAARTLYLNTASPKTDAGGQRLWLAPSSTSATTGLPTGNTTFETHAVTFDGTILSAKEFHPVLAEADLAVDAVRQLGADPIQTFTYHAAYLVSAFGGVGNPRDVLLQL